MSQINELSQVDPSGSQLVPVWDTPNGTTRNVSVSSLATFIQAQSGDPGALETQFYAPNANGWSVTVSPTVNGNSVWLVLTPTGTFAAATVNLPALASLVDLQEVLVTCTQVVTALTVGNGGATVNGAPTTLAANGFFRMKYEATAQAWYRVS